MQEFFEVMVGIYEIYNMTSECDESVSQQGTSLQEWMQRIWNVATGQSHAEVLPALLWKP